jgi:hypothetical protein
MLVSCELCSRVFNFSDMPLIHFPVLTERSPINSKPGSCINVILSGKCFNNVRQVREFAINQHSATAANSGSTYKIKLQNWVKLGTYLIECNKQPHIICFLYLKGLHMVLTSNIRRVMSKNVKCDSPLAINRHRNPLLNVHRV